MTCFPRLAFVPLFAFLPACGGTVVVDASGGGGDAVTTTTTSTTTTFTTTTSTSTTTTWTTTAEPQDCSGFSDVQIFASTPVWSILVQCGYQYLENEPGLSMCIEMSTGLSFACAGCCDAYVHCTIQNCISPCAAAPDSPECADCRKQSCDGAFMKCGNVPFAPQPL